MSISAKRTRSDVEQEIAQILGLVPGFFAGIPDDAIEHEWALFRRFELEETLIPLKYKQLMAIAVHAETKCRYCSLFHTELARLFGATDAEIQEANHFAKHTVAWSVYLNGTRYDYDTFERELQRIIRHAQSN